MSKSKQHRGKFRHIFGDSAKPEKQFQDIKKPLCSGQGSYASSNSRFFAVSRNSGGGPVYIIRHDKPGRIASNQAMLSVHKGQVWDSDFNPFVPNVIATASNDCKVGITSFPIDGLTQTITKPSGLLKGHGKKVVLVEWNPSANSIIASGSFDKTVRVWNVEKSACVTNFTGMTDNLYSMKWNRNGSMLATTSKDKKLRLWDPRTDDNVSLTESFDGTKSSHLFWVDKFNWIGCTGFNKLAKRKIRLWDIRKIEKPIVDNGIDQAASILLPNFDHDTGVLFLAGKGESQISYSEIVNDDRKIYNLGVFRKPEPQKGGCWVPKKALDVWKCEIGRFLKVTAKSVIPVSFVVPRKAGSDVFQADIFPDAFAGKPSLQCEQWINGENKDPILMSLDPSLRKDEDFKNIPKMSITAQKSNISDTKSSSSVTSPKIPISVSDNKTKLLNSEITSLKNENSDLKQKLNDEQKQNGLLKNENSDLNQTIKTNNSEIKELKNLVSELEEKINNLNKQIENQNKNKDETTENTNEINTNETTEPSEETEKTEVVENTQENIQEKSEETTKEKTENPFEDEDDDDSSLF